MGQDQNKGEVRDPTLFFCKSCELKKKGRVRDIKIDSQIILNCQIQILDGFVYKNMSLFVDAIVIVTDFLPLDG